jgi:hypothetical protein
MGLRFRRSIRILPGLRLNLGKRGTSVSVGVRGAHLTVGHGQARETVGLPGTGLSYTHVDRTHQEVQAPGVQRHWPWFSLLVLLGLIAFLVHLIRQP